MGGELQSNNSKFQNIILLLFFWGDGWGNMIILIHFFQLVIKF